MKLALKHEGNLAVLSNIKEDFRMEQGVSVGSVWLAYDLARRLGIARALGSSRKGKLSLWQGALGYGTWSLWATGG